MAELAYGVAFSILEKLGSSVYEDLGLACGMKNDLNKLKDQTLTLQSVLGDAEKKQTNNEPVKNWLVRVKDVFNDAIDVLDEFECEMLRRQVVKEYGGAGEKVSHFFSRSNLIGFRFSIAHKVKEIRERLDEIERDIAQFQLISSGLNVVGQPSQLSDMRRPFFNAPKVIGRDGDKDAIVAILLSNSDDRLSVIPIEGIGGLGKTTLVRSVFDDSKLDNNAFNLKLWVVVSLEFDVIRIEREILKEIQKDDVSNMEPHRLHDSLRSKLHGKKLLLVLDDVWNEDRLKWTDLRALLVAAEKGSKVVVTTRSANVSSIMTRTPAYKLKGLSEECSMSLFFTCAFDDERLADNHRTLKEIGEEIVRKCGGVPLALKTLGSLLYSMDEVEWKRVRDNEIWELEREDGRILPALRLSYNTMSPCLKQCFAYCATFPDDTLMGEIELTSIWVAHGILHSRHKDVELEDIAKEQIKELRARSFFQCDDKDEIFKDYVMHDLIHDLARSVTENESWIIKCNPPSLPERVRNLRISLSQDNITSVETSGRLWSLHVDKNSTYEITESFLSTCIEKLRYLRVFDLKGLWFEVLPNSIENLKHLRYLNFSENKWIKRLPDSICKLQSLQTLLLGGCSELKELPRKIRRLVSLRTLVVTTKQYSFPENGIGRLKSLRTLIIEECENLKSLPRDMKYCAALRTLILRSCGKLNLACESDGAIDGLSLQKLVISGLRKMTDFPQWLEGAFGTLELFSVTDCIELASLPEWLPRCTQLQTLVVSWCHKLATLPSGMQHLASLTRFEIKSCWKLDLTQQLVNATPLVLQTMKISDLPKTRALPQWLGGASNTLKLFEVSECFKLVTLPEWLPTFSSLKSIYIWDCDKLLFLPMGMQHLTSLTSLRILSCKQLELASECSEIVHLSLQSFEIRELPKTTALPQWLQGAAHTLQTMRINKCHRLAALPEWLVKLTSLESLVISDCQQLELASEVTASVQLNLQVFEINKLPETTSIPKWLHGASNTLKRFVIDFCPKLVTLPEWLPTFSSLKKMKVWGCDRLLVLPMGMQHLTSLTYLDIRACEQLELASESSEIVHLSLQSFFISDLPKTTALPQWLQGVAHTLQTMRIDDCHKLAALPEWLVNLTSLENLVIFNCPELSSLPEGMSRLTSLTHLHVEIPSPAFHERYKPEVGRDWSAISHIPKIHIRSPRIRSRGESENAYTMFSAYYNRRLDCGCSSIPS